MLEDHSFHLLSQKKYYYIDLLYFDYVEFIIFIASFSIKYYVPYACFFIIYTLYINFYVIINPWTQTIFIEPFAFVKSYWIKEPIIFTQAKPYACKLIFSGYNFINSSQVNTYERSKCFSRIFNNKNLFLFLGFQFSLPFHHGLKLSFIWKYWVPQSATLWPFVNQSWQIIVCSKSDFWTLFWQRGYQKLS